MNCLVAACVIAWGLYLAITLAKFRLSLRTIQHESRDAPAFAADQMTIVQPILGGDPRLVEVLRATLANTPKAVRFLWVVQRDDAAGRAAVEAAREGHSQPIEIVYSDPAAATVNPKLHKLEAAWATIKTPYFAVLDDDTTISEHNLRVAVAALAGNDLYTGVPCYTSASRFWDALLTHFVNNNSILTYMSMLPLAGPLTINGMFYVMRTETLRALGGFAPIRTRLCDDYAVARLLLDNGRQIHQGTVPQYLCTSVAGFTHYFQIMHRWFLFAGFLVRDQRLSVRLLLLVMLGLPPLLLWGGLLGTTTLTLAVLLGHADAACAAIGLVAMGVALPARHGLIRFLHRKLLDRETPFRPAFSLLSELLQPIHWLHSVLSREIQWRTLRIRVNRDNTFRALEG